MKLLYGVQGTGNGHITRARAMQSALSKKGIAVDWVFSGREKDKFFDMTAFGDFSIFEGLSFVVESGQIKIAQTIKKAGLKQLYHDINQLDVSGYDCIITDYEPVVAWAARQHKVPCIGLGHQYAFEHDIPKAGGNMITQSIMKWFAPCSIGVGVHWHHFNKPILPPIIEQHHLSSASLSEPATLVYLPFENSSKILSTLRQSEHRFIYHCGDIEPGEYDNVIVRPFSREGFQNSLANTDGVICNAGFELASEALSLGRKLMVKPISGQMEQISNALALSKLKLGLTTTDINDAAIERYLTQAWQAKIDFPDVPQLIVNWLEDYPNVSVSALAEQCWQGVSLPAWPSA